MSVPAVVTTATATSVTASVHPRTCQFLVNPIAHMPGITTRNVKLLKNPKTSAENMQVKTFEVAPSITLRLINKFPKYSLDILT